MLVDINQLSEPYMTPNLLSQNSALSQAKERDSLGLGYKIKVKNSSTKQEQFLMSSHMNKST